MIKPERCGSMAVRWAVCGRLKGEKALRCDQLGGSLRPPVSSSRQQADRRCELRAIAPARLHLEPRLRCCDEALSRAPTCTALRLALPAPHRLFVGRGTQALCSQPAPVRPFTETGCPLPAPLDPRAPPERPMTASRLTTQLRLPRRHGHSRAQVFSSDVWRRIWDLSGPSLLRSIRGNELARNAMGAGPGVRNGRRCASAPAAPAEHLI